MGGAPGRRAVAGLVARSRAHQRLGGDRYRVAWRSRIPYELEFDFAVERTESPREMEGRATGALTGTGHWRLFEQDGVTAVLYDWHVQTTKRWMNAIGPVARPVLEY